MHKSKDDTQKALLQVYTQYCVNPQHIALCENSGWVDWGQSGKGVDISVGNVTADRMP